MKTLVILGGGFAGINVAVHLSKALKGQGEIVLVDVKNYHLFKPMLHEVATASVEPGHITQPIRHIMENRRFSFVQGLVQHIDLSGRSITLCKDCKICFERSECPLEDFDVEPEMTQRAKRHHLSYDYLILALGGSPNYFGIEGAQRFAFPLNGLEDAKRLRDHILHAFDIASRVESKAKKEKILTFAIVGAGPTGIEFVNDLHDWVHGALREEFPDIVDQEVKIYLIEAGNDILPASPEQVRQTAKELLHGKSVVLQTGQPAVRVGKDFVKTKNGMIRTYTTVWTAGIQGNNVLCSTGLTLDPFGRVVVGKNLNAQGFPEVYAIGDCSFYALSEATQPLPQTGQVAVQQAHYLSRQLARLLSGKPMEPFSYRELGSAFSTGRYQGIANLLGLFRLRGLMGWVVWKITYLKHLVGIRLSVRSILDWFLDITYNREASRHKF
jgi:NADH dehydrogenase